MAAAAANTAHEELTGDLLKLSKLVDPVEIIAASSDDYLDNTETWSAAKNKHPRLVLRPKTIESLSKIVEFLATTDLDYKARSRGFGNSSATDVLISLQAFNDFQYNEEDKSLILGTGNTWRDYYRQMDEAMPGYTIVSARTPGIGVGGATLTGGLSWLSPQFGLSSDATNLLDIKVVMADGQIKWASEDPDLLWAMRGTEGGFAIATQFKFRAHPLPENGRIWGGPIMIPRDKFPEAAKGIASMLEKDKQGEFSDKIAIYVYVLRKEQLKFVNVTDDVLVAHAYDGRGEVAGREAFKWALDIEGAIDQTRSDMTLSDIAKMQDGADALRGKSDTFWNPIALTKSGPTALTESIILKSFTWWTSMLSDPTSIADHGWLFLELFVSRDNLSGFGSSGWPRPPGFKHLLLLGTGCAPDSTEEVRQRAKRYIVEGTEEILGRGVREVDSTPNAIEEFHDVERIYGAHFERLRGVKTRVDPRDRLQGWIRPYSRSGVAT